MLRKKLGYIVLGTVLGSVLTLSTGAFAETSKLVSAYLGNHIRFEFNGEIKKTSGDKPAIIYKDSVYVPIRFIAEGTGMPINWNSQTQTVEIKTPEPEVIEKVVYVEVPKEDKEVKDEKKEDKKDSRDYHTLPISKSYTNMEVKAINILKEENQTKIFFEVKNKESYPLQLIQSETIIEVDGKPYKMSDKPTVYWDTNWYNDIRKDEISEGYIIFNEIPKDAKGIHIVLRIMQNDGSGKYNEVPFDIKVE
ncbi:stalk domain-containing protein [Defluviitalea saccharophila]|uniref:Stalk domain-containing protein n=1 Tax=Defluviitalea saccharophila TaxID=879970 RepID=A0ABZ2Y552_9FIRM